MATFKGMVNLRKRINSADPASFRKRVAPVFQEALIRAYSSYAETLASESVNPNFDNGSVASGNLLRAFNKDLKTALTVSASRLYFSIGIKGSAATSQRGNPAEYYEVLDDSGNPRLVPTEARILRWAKDRGILTSVNDRVKVGARWRPARYLIRSIIRSILERTRRGGYRSLRLTKKMQDSIGLANDRSDLRTKIRGLALYTQ